MESEFARSAEHSLIKKFRKSIWVPFVRGVNEYEMLKEGDKVAVCISGGKDSMMLAKCMQELKKHGKFKFELVFLVMDPGYEPENRKKIKENAKLLDVPITIFNSDIFKVVDNVGGGSPCYLCARMRRGCLYKKAQELGCNKIALGHHFDDVIETVLISMLYGGEFKTMVPKLHSKNFAGMELIRPMYLVRESAIIAWRNYHKLEFLNCACMFTKNVADARQSSKRAEIKELIAKLKDINENVDINIFRSTHNVNTDTLVGYKNSLEENNFLKVYNSKCLGSGQDED